jgi:hypothetical protein
MLYKCDLFGVYFLTRTLLIILMRYDKLGQKLETPVDICPYLCLDDYISSDCLPPPT